MRHAKRAPLRIDHLDHRARRRMIALDDVAGENPGMSGCYPVGGFTIDFDFGQRIACRRAIRSSVEGCVENIRVKNCPVNGLMMNRCCVAGEASIGIRFE